MRWHDQLSRGDAVISSYGLEGGAVYPFASALSEATAEGAAATMSLDLRPDMSEGQIADRLRQIRPRDSLSNGLRRTLSLAPAAIALLREVRRDLPRDAAPLAALIKALPLAVTGTEGLARAISSAGGVAWGEIDDRMMLRTPARRVRRGRNAGLGCADGRLSAAGELRNRLCCRPGSARLAADGLITPAPAKEV